MLHGFVPSSHKTEAFASASWGCRTKNSLYEFRAKVAQGVIKLDHPKILWQSFFIFWLAKSLHSVGHRSLQWQANCSKQAAQAKPKGLFRLFCAGSSKLQNNLLFPLSPTFSVEPRWSLRSDLFKDVEIKKRVGNKTDSCVGGVPYGIRTHDIQNHNLTL